MYFHLLVLSYTIDGTEYASHIALRGQLSCARTMDGMYPTLLKEHPDSMAQCIKTDTVSGWNIRPKARPAR